MKTMKNLFGALPLAAFMLAFTACDKNDGILNETENETETVADGERVRMTFTAGNAETRTELAGNKVLWQVDDAISVFAMGGDGTNISNDEFTTSDAGESATFSGTTTVANEYMALYPYQEDAGIGATDDYPILIKGKLPAEQQAVAGGFAPELNLSCARTTKDEMNFTFHNLCALVKFRMTGNSVNEIQSVALTNENWYIAGILDFCLNEDLSLKKVNSPSTDRSTQITLTSPEGGFQEDVDYYFVLAPMSFPKGFTITYTKKDGSVFYRKGTGLDVAAGKILNIGDIEPDKFTEQNKQNKITNKDFIAWIDTYNRIGWTKDSEGNVPLTDENLQVIEGVKLLSFYGAGWDDITDIKYFTGLTTLMVSNNALTSLDVSKLVNLETLRCDGNQLKTLDVSMLENLNRLICNGNQLETLDVSMLANLKQLYCWENNLKSLRLTNSLEDLQCQSCRLETLDVSELVNITNLCVYDNHLTKLDIRNLTNHQVTLMCGNQTDATTGESQNLKLILTSDQKDMWDNILENHPKWNDNVTIQIGIEYGGSSDDMEGGDETIWAE